MEVILKQDIDKLGYKDDLVKVKAGYGRNFLIPQGKAAVATDSAKKVRTENLKQRAHKEAKVKEGALKMVASVQAMSIKVGAKVGEQGKIFGSVSSLQVAEAMAALGVTVDRKDIKITAEPIKSVGTYEAVVKFHREISETISFEVVGE